MKTNMKMSITVNAVLFYSAVVGTQKCIQYNEYYFYISIRIPNTEPGN